MIALRIHLSTWRKPCFESYANGDWTLYIGGPVSIAYSYDSVLQDYRKHLGISWRKLMVRINGAPMCGGCITHLSGCVGVCKRTPDQRAHHYIYGETDQNVR